MSLIPTVDNSTVESSRAIQGRHYATSLKWPLVEGKFGLILKKTYIQGLDNLPTGTSAFSSSIFLIGEINVYCCIQLMREILILDFS